MSLLGTQVFANPATPCWLSTAGGAVDGPLTVKDSLAVIPSTLSGSASLILGPIPTGDAPYTSLIVSTPVDIATSLGSELLFYTRRNTPGLPPSLAMSIDSVQDITMEQNLNVVGTIATSKLILPTTGTARTAGIASIPVGQATLIVPTTAVTADSIILITRMGDVSGGPAIGSGQQTIMAPTSQIVPGLRFQVGLVNPASGTIIAASTVDAEFSWVIIN